MSESVRKAVFISYASQDVDAAQRISEALRSGGVEVWFDAGGGLEHGDEWDAKIRRQIKECILFIPLISATTQARLEGYFRLEWELAAQRAMSIAAGVPFILPLVLDDTVEADALVPDRFRLVEWTRVPAGELSTALRARILSLWSHRVGALKHGDIRAPGAAYRPPPLAPAERGPARRRWLLAGLAAVVFAAAGWWFRPGSAREINEKSVAVLAFENLSDDKSAEYFSDGISEELLNVLAKVPGLRVSARMSAFSFKDKNVGVTEIGHRLGVAWVLEGSVRKAGDSVRISARLSRTATAEQLWAESYTRDLRDVFEVQSELARTVVEQLRGHIGGKEASSAKAEIHAQVKAAAKGGTTNAEAYQQYLQGKYFANQHSPENRARALGYFQQAVKLDAAFALAWAALGRTGARDGDGSTTTKDLAKGFERARAAAKQALALEPGLAEGHAALMEVQIAFDFDWRGARESARRALELAPADGTNISNAARLACCFGELQRSVELGRKAAALDPINPEIPHALSRSLAMLGRFKEAEAEQRRALELSPGITGGHGNIAVILLLQNRPEAALVEAESERREWSRLYSSALVQGELKNMPAADAALAHLIETYAEVCAFQVAEVYAYRGELDRAFEWLERAYQQHDMGISYTKHRPTLARLRMDPRWPVFLNKIGLADAQVK